MNTSFFHKDENIYEDNGMVSNGNDETVMEKTTSEVEAKL